MPENMNYSESRKSQENKNLLKKIDDSLKDNKKIDNSEAKEIQNEYKKLKSNIVAITKEELASFAKGLDLEESASLGKTLNKLREKSNESITPETGTNSPGESTPTQVVHPETTEGESTTVESNINKAKIISYFGIKNSETLTKGLEESGLNLFKMLNGYKDYIENDLKGLDSTIINKIKTSILIKTGLINGVIKELREDNKDSDVSLKNYRWILNEQITDIFEQINTEILPSAFFLLKYNESGDKSKFLDNSIKGVYKKQRRGSHGVKNNSKINLKFEEIQEMFASNLDDEGNFDEGLFSTQDVLGTGNKNDNNILKNIGFDDSGISEISLLSEADKKIEADIMIKYMAFVGFMMIPYAGATASIPSDLIDLFSSTEGTITMMKTLGFIQDDYEMSKSWVDNAFGAIGIVGSIFGIQAIAKGKKLVKVTSKLNKLGVSSSDIAIRIKEETKILKAKFGTGDDILNKAPGTGIQRIVEEPIIKGNKLEIKLGNGERIKLFDEVFSVEKKGEDYILKNGDNLYIIKKGSESNIGPYKYKLVGNKLIIKNEIKIIHGLTDQTKIPKIEQLPVLKVEQLPILIKEVEGISDIRNPELIKEFSEKIYKPVLDIKDSSKIIEAEIIEPKIVENISKLDKILANIDNLKQSFKLKGEKISDLFSKTLEGIKNYILGLKKSIKLKKSKSFELPGGVKLKKGAIFSHRGYDFKIIKVGDNGNIIISSISNKEDSVTAMITVRKEYFDSDMIKGINKNRYMKMRGKKSKAEGEQYIPEKKVTLSKSEKLIKDFDNLPKSEHAQELLEAYPHLKPVDTLEINGKTFYFSEVQNGSYEEVVGFIEVKGKIETRLFYKSNSDGGWRSTPGKRLLNGGYSKGESIIKKMSNGEEVESSYTVTTKVDDRIGNMLDSLKKVERKGNDIGDAFLGIKDEKQLQIYSKYYQEKVKLLQKAKKELTKENYKIAEKQINDQLIVKYNIEDIFKIDLDSYDNYDNFGINMDAMKGETFIFDDGGILGILREKGNPGMLDTDFKGDTIKDIKKYFHDLEYGNDFIPSFNNGPIKSYETNHKIAGRINIDIFEGSLPDGKKIEWHMAQSIDNPEQIWISNIRLADGKVNSFGIDTTFINSGILNNKPFEYSSGLPEGLKKGPKIVAPNGSEYIDITPILAELQPIKEYKQYLESIKLKKAA